MTLADDTRWLDATDQAALVSSGDASPSELLEAAIERVEQLDGPLNAVNIRWFDHARKLASDPDLPDGPFRGVPFLLKDLGAHFAGQPMTNGNAALAKHLPISSFDTDLVSRYRAAGLVIAGRTNSPEFGSLPVTESTAHGATRNPWALDRTPGGSSGGAAAAVASGMVPVAHGSDGGGSIRIPASCCGLFGLKPSQGRITMAPDGNETSVGVDHVLSRSVRDSARMLDATHGRGAGDMIAAQLPQRPYADEVGVDPGALRIGILDHDPCGAPVDEHVVAAVRDAGVLLESLGHRVEPGHPEAMADPSTGMHYGTLRSPRVLLTIEQIAATVGRELEEDDVESMNWAQAEMGKDTLATTLLSTMDAVLDHRRKIHRWWDDDGWDLLLTPTLASLPLPIGALAPVPGDKWANLMKAGAFVPFTPTFNTTGQPAVSVPLYWTDDGIPVGVQLVAAYGREDLLIQISSQLETARPWAHRKPPPTEAEGTTT